jgi:hypothetical protein
MEAHTTTRFTTGPTLPRSWLTISSNWSGTTPGPEVSTTRGAIDRAMRALR